jgi:predicted DNA-binding transcriptional regulator AlpA
MRVLTAADLRDRKGIAWSRQHLWRKVRAGEFPKPFKLSGRERGPNVWDEGEIDEWLRSARNRSSTTAEPAAAEAGA